MFRIRKIFLSCLVIQIASMSLAQRCLAQTAQYPAPRTQLAFATPNAASNLQMLRAEASVLYSGSQFLAAVEVYKRLIQLGSVDATDRYWLGEGFYHAGNIPQAAVAFEQAIQLNPKFELAHARLTESYLAMHQKDKARQVCDNALHVVTDPYLHQQLAVLLKVASCPERKPSRSPAQGPARMPSEM